MTMYSAGEAYQGVGRGAEDVEPIAIVGIGCRLPGGVESPAEFWELLKSGTDAITEVPKARYNIEKFYDPDQSKPGKTTSKWGGFVKQPIDTFDASFFSFSPREAACLDPLQRWLLTRTENYPDFAGSAR